MERRRLSIGTLSLTSVVLLQINQDCGHDGSPGQNIGIIPPTIILSIPIHLELFMGGTHPFICNQEYTTPVCEVDRLLTKKDAILDELTSHLMRARSQMKATADAHKHDVQFQEGDLVYLKIKPYRQRSLAHCKNEKLAPSYYGPYEVLKKVGAVAYKLKLPPSATIHPVFHVSQLRKAVGATHCPQPLPSQLSADMELPTEPAAVLGIRAMQGRGTANQEVLRKDLPEFEETRELSSVIQQQFPHFHLEDKVLLLAG